MRGRLINPFIAEIAQLDTLATDANGTNGGYDKIFREPKNLPTGKNTRLEKSPVFLHCQVEVETFEEQMQRRAANDTNSLLRLVFHFQELEDKGFVDPTTGDALLRVNDRLVSIRRCRDQSLVQHAGFSEGFYATEVQPQSFGLVGGERNLLIVTFKTRDSSYSGGTAA